MSFSDYKPAATDPVIGDNDPFYSNTWDKCQQACQDALEEYHTAGGVHNDPAITGTNYGLMYTKPGTYTGDTETDQVITITDMAEVLYFQMWEESSAFPIVALASMDAGDAKRLTNEAFTTSYIKSLGTGQVTVTGSGNTNGTTYYYLAIGKKATAPAGNGGSFTPSWIQHNDSIDVSGASKVPNDLLDELITRFTAEHNDDPAPTHKSTAYQDVAKIEVGDYDGSNVERNIPLSVSGADVRSVEIYQDIAEYPVVCTRSMGTNKSKRISNTALEADLIKDLATAGQFTVSTGDAVNGKAPLFVAGGSSTNTLAYSSDGINWTGLGASIFSTACRGIAWNGTRFVACGEGTNTLAYSSDGINWIGLGTSIFSTRGYAVAWNGTRFVAVGQGTNTIAYSSDGINWTGIGTSIFSTAGRGIAWNGTRFVGCGNGTNTLAYSTDGITWTGLGTSIFSNIGYGAAWNGTRFVGCGNGTANTLAYSTDGITWTGNGKTIFTGSAYGAAWNGTRFVGCGNGTNTLAHSTDGITWTGLGTSIFGTDCSWAAWNGIRFVAVGLGGNSLAYSTDGITWTPNGTSIFSVAYGVTSAPAPQMTPAINIGGTPYKYYWKAIYK